MNRIPAAAIALACIGFMACQKQAAKSPAPDIPAVPSAATKAFTLTVSSGGGFAGLYHGCTLTSAGQVKAWSQRPGTPESVAWTVQTGTDSILALAKALEAYVGADLQETGNMTARIRYALPDSTYQWSISGAGASAEAPEPFRTWYARAEAYCQGLAPQP